MIPVNEITLGTRYKMFINRKLGNGAFGDVYQGQNKKDKTLVAIKVEKNKDERFSQLKNEANLLKYLSGCEGIPKIYFHAKTNKYSFLVMELLGPSLANLFLKTKNNLPLKHIINYSLQMLDRIEYIHQRHIIHRDIKPENFLISKNRFNQEIIYLIDFGLAKRFRDPKTGLHIHYKDGKSLTGTARFASIYTHLGIEQSRRDDLEGIIYTLIYFYKGNLPWQNINNCNEKILEKKINISIDSLCEGMPIEFNDLLSYVRSLQFDEKPDYEMMRKKLVDLLNKEKLSINNINFDWIEKNLSNDNLSTLDDDI